MTSSNNAPVPPITLQLSITLTPPITGSRKQAPAPVLLSLYLRYARFKSTKQSCGTFKPILTYWFSVKVEPFIGIAVLYVKSSSGEGIPGTSLNLISIGVVELSSIVYYINIKKKYK